MNDETNQEAVLPLLRQSVAPQLVGMSSTVAYRGVPRSEAYGASKAAIKNLFESLHLDLAREGISVSVVCPGFGRTN
ncbi:MAG: SDR family NAD(P)-dependent oxidoreductase [Nitrospira sp.]|nr:SDR family NAD(P)-dependent oxidoreductase [Nitrospira sp.]